MCCSRSVFPKCSTLSKQHSRYAMWTVYCVAAVSESWLLPPCLSSCLFSFLNYCWHNGIVKRDPNPSQPQIIEKLLCALDQNKSSESNQWNKSLLLISEQSLKYALLQVFYSWPYGRPLKYTEATYWNISPILNADYCIFTLSNLQKNKVNLKIKLRKYYIKQTVTLFNCAKCRKRLLCSPNTLTTYWAHQCCH